MQKIKSIIAIFLLAVTFCNVAKAEESYFFGIRTHDFKSFGYAAQVCKKDICLDTGVHDKVLTVNILGNVVSSEKDTVWARAQGGFGILHHYGSSTTISGIIAAGVGTGSNSSGIEAIYKFILDRDNVIMSGWDIGMRSRNVEQPSTVTKEIIIEPNPVPTPEPTCKHPLKYHCGEDDKHKKKHK